MPTSRAIKGLLQGSSTSATSNRRDAHGGFSMIEVVLALVLLSLLATLALPFSRQTQSATALKAEALEVAALLRAERNAARSTGTSTVVRIDIASGVLQARRSAASIQIPASIVLQMKPATARAFQFLPNGRASGGVLSLSSGQNIIAIDVNAATAKISLLDGVNSVLR